VTDTTNAPSSDAPSGATGIIGRAIRVPLFKLFLIAVLIVALMVPMTMVSGLIGERESRAMGVRSEVASLWGSSQLITGPLLVVPYSVLRVTTVGDKRVEEVQERRAVFSPETLTVKSEAKSTLLHRSIFDVPVYSSELAFEGRFLAPRISDVATQVHEVRWREAVLVVSINDVSGLKAAANVAINDADTVAFEPSLGLPGANLNGVHIKLMDAASLGLAGDPAAPPTFLPAFGFKFDLRLNGSGQLDFAPVARETSVAMTADWPHPSFGGSFLPVERSISKDGFSARWYVPHLARSVPQAWNLNDGGIERIRAYGFGTRFYTPVDFYNLITRASKYAVMFLGAAFMAVFLLEFRSVRQVHPVQYGFVGFAMVFFYVLLLSFAEQIGFVKAYVVAAAATGGLLAVYVGRVQQSLAKGAATLALFLILYGLLYMILGMEDYALLAGAILGFVLLATVMFATLRVDWSGGGLSRHVVPPTPPPAAPVAPAAAD
jgi:inner membrane protein